MDFSMLDGVEKQLTEWYKNLPSMPKGFNDWLAKYAWIFALVGGIFGALAVLPLLGALGILSTFAVAVGGGLYVLLSWLALIALILTVILTFMAVSPLKEQKEKGWKIMFFLEFFYMVYGVLNWLASPSQITGLFGTFLGAAIGFYFLFQVRKYFK